MIRARFTDRTSYPGGDSQVNLMVIISLAHARSKLADILRGIRRNLDVVAVRDRAGAPMERQYFITNVQGATRFERVVSLERMPR